eukprot:GHUV01000654.1.p1 GENE.GHUV01000654.1~~GHUV01000654.1.p1  ORF type:complete len:256 (+),score=36.69 GHUV01000654.1:77-844(+)
MKASSQLALVLCVAALFAVVVIAETDKSEPRWSYFYLVRQWPASFCNDRKCTTRPPKGVFTVHGLWPQRDDGSWPQNCDARDELDEDQIEDLLPDLQVVWPSYTTDDYTFWNHEWTKHGTCAESVVDGEKDYFQEVIRLHKLLNIQDAFKKAGINLSVAQTVPSQKLIDAIENAYGVTPIINCEKSGELSEVIMCISKDLKPIDCKEPPAKKNANKNNKQVVERSQSGNRRNLMSQTAASANPSCKNVKIPVLSN